MDYDVIIAGAGPVGLFLAGELRLAKLSVLVLEQAVDPHTPLKRLPFGMRGLWGPSVETFHRRGLLDAIAAQPDANNAPGQPKPGSMATQRGPAGHFAGIQFDYANIESSRWTWRLPGPADTQLGCEMEHLERVLSAHALSAGVEIRRGQGVEGFDAGDDGVTVHAGSQRLRARFLVGCDGGRSLIRKQGGFDFVGTDPEFTGYSVLADFSDPSVLPMGRHYTPTGMFTHWQSGAVAIADFDGGAFHRAQPVSLEHVQEVLRRVSGTDITLTALRLASTWTDRSMQATSYRNGRVLLAGDAAHIHSPLGGQGLNLGLGDAMNLGWKLAAAVGGGAPPDLLESYQAERHRVGRQVLMLTDGFNRLVLGRSAVQRAVQARMVRLLVGIRPTRDFIAGRLTGLGIAYPARGRGHHRWVGKRAPDLPCADGRLYELLREGRHVLVGADAPDNPRIRSTHRVGPGAPSTVLVRPDAYVAWAHDGTPTAHELATMPLY